MKKKKQKKVALGIDFGATNIKALVMDNEGKEYFRYVKRSEPARGPEKTLNDIISLIHRAIKDASAAKLELTGIGIGVCGPINYEKGEIVESPVLPGWTDVPIMSTITEAIPLPIHLENDANVAILGEWWRGSGEKCPVIAGVTLGTGIGGGLAINGHIYRGGFGFGAEFGHIQVTEGPECPCGGRGCLGTVASISATLQRYQELAGKGAVPVNGLLELSEFMKHGDIAAIQAISTSVEYIAKATLILINSINPNIFVYTGGMAASLGNVLLDAVQKHISSSTFKTIAKNTRITTARLGIFSGCFGAAWLAISGTKVLP